MRRTTVLLAGVSLAAGSLPGLVGPAAAESADPVVVGSMGVVFMDPAEPDECDALDGSPHCKPAAVSVTQLADGRILYWDGLEGQQQVQLHAYLEADSRINNSPARVMDLSGDKSWKDVTPDVDPDGNSEELLGGLLGALGTNENTSNDYDLFCSDLVNLPDGRVLAIGGSGWHMEPGIPGTDLGLVEITGVRANRIFDPKTNTWKLGGKLNTGRWYPSAVTLPSGRIFVASGVEKLLKPIYLDDPLASLANVRTTETYDPATDTWTENPSSANKSLPLYPRLFLLPNGRVYFDSNGQTWNPMGAAIDEALWNMTSVFNPDTKTWRNLGVSKINGMPLGFRGTGFSVMLPLQPDDQGRYTEAKVLSGGGVIGTSPGTYLATDSVTLNTIGTATAEETFESTSVRKLNRPRWYPHSVLMPDGKVFVTNGASADETVMAGSAFAIHENEIYDPATDTWTDVASQDRDRTYHNTAMLLPDGRILLGGHAPLPSFYWKEFNFLHDLLGTSPAERDPSFQIYSPPYLHWGPRPEITGLGAMGWDRTVRIEVDSPSAISSVRMFRNTTATHLVDSDQRAVDLRIVGRTADSVTVAVPGREVLPPGPYMLFANRTSERGEIPSVSRQVVLGAPTA